MIDFSDKQRVEIAKQQYAEHQVGSIVTIDNDKVKIGYVIEVIHNNETNEHTYIITSEKLSSNPKVSELDTVENVIVLYRGSTKPFGGESWTTDWFDRERPLSGQLNIGNGNQSTAQLESASQTLKTAMERYRNAKFDIYGHSIGSMNGQYAICDSYYPERIRCAYLYEGQNTYSILNERQRINADRLRRRIYNYIDEHDLIAIGYGDGHAVGIVIRIDSKRVGETQHMWGGYQFDLKGDIIAPTESHIEVKMAQVELRILERLNKLSQVAGRLQSDGGKMSSPEEIYLDSNEALIILEGATNLVEVGFSEIINQYKKAIIETQEHWKETIKVAQLFASYLSEDEIMIALAEGGATQATIVDNPIIYYEMMIARANTIQSKYENLIVHIKSIISEMANLDQSLGEELKL